MSEQFKKTFVETIRELDFPKFMERQLATSKIINEMLSPQYMERQLATSKMINEMLSPQYMERQLATSKMINEMLSPQYMERQLATSKMISEMLSPKFMEYQLATSKMMSEMSSPKFMERQLATSKMFSEIFSPKFMERQLASSKMFSEIFSPKFMERQLNNPASKMIQELSNSVNLQNFVGRLTTDSFSHLMRQAEIVDITLLDDFDESDIQAFKDYSQNELSQKPEQFIATQTTEPSKYGQLIISIILELLKVFIYPYLFAILQAQVALPFLSTDKTATEKQVIIAAKRDFCEEQLSVCRFVKSTKLNVRASAGQKYQVIDTLNFGQGVIIDTFEVNEKDRDWVFVSYYDKTSESYKNGWVFRRYLRRYVP
ncbi:SH3 domain-containing protein [Shewanella sp. SW36]|uniref:SH3 domain-containing protein n=1 Tax=unclassified Shewanella TaxID=196818 RepID=UPI0021DAEFC0|nr:MULTISPECIES: SH3 domain-containing protein [unclassified Shewanella]MCU7976919.1 SH3 domain-containing protein [Shewanella sp. SW36]MCU7992159.1 SH3 domain-containing protein [Shewanella sp. SW1]MCU8053931.1 SH3 domain-containing protein [Shewanella sp. SM43]